MAERLYDTGLRLGWRVSYGLAGALFLATAGVPLGVVAGAIGFAVGLAAVRRGRRSWRPSLTVLDGGLDGAPGAPESPDPHLATAPESPAANGSASASAPQGADD